LVFANAQKSQSGKTKRVISCQLTGLTQFRFKDKFYEKDNFISSNNVFVESSNFYCASPKLILEISAG